MIDSILFDDMQSGEEGEVITMIEECFKEFVAPDFLQEGIDEFLKFINQDALKQRIELGNFVLTAKINKEIIGAIEMESCNHVCLLFVKKKYHRRGIAKILFQRAIDKCKDKNPSIEKIYVNSSPYAIKIYERMGFVATDEEQMKNGIRFIPMAYKV